jgi:hypothetical protein
MIVGVMAACLIGGSATVAVASSDSTSRCLGACHATGTDATIGASLVSTSTTTATYDVTMGGAAGSGWAVFDGSTRLTGATAATGTIVVDLGKTYDLFAVDGVAQTCATTSVSPAAPAVETTVSLDESIPPVTTSDAKDSYTDDATVELTATDGEGQGVAYIYYSVDGDRVHLFTVGMVAQTSVVIEAPIVGTVTHTIAFWSQDKAGNVEAHNSKTLTVSAAAPTAPVATTLTIKAGDTSLRYGKYVTISSTLSGGVPAGSHVRYQARFPGKHSYSIISSTRDVTEAGYSSIRYKLTKRGTYYFQARFLGVDGFAPSNSRTVKVVVK